MAEIEPVPGLRAVILRQPCFAVAGVGRMQSSVAVLQLKRRTLHGPCAFYYIEIFYNQNAAKALTVTI